MFELSIKCSKDIDELHIDFSDGSSTVVEKPKEKKVTTPKKKTSEKLIKTKYQDDEVDWDEYTGGISQEVVKLPEIPKTDRNVSVSEDMKNAEYW